jgi:hypothetical protein
MIKMIAARFKILTFSWIYPVVFCVLFTNNLSGQQFIFKVLTTSGNIEYRPDKNNPWSKVVIGDLLKSNSEIKLLKNSYAALMYNDRRVLELTEDRSYSASDLENLIKTSKRTITQKFTEFVSNEIISDKSEKKDMKTFAAVVRVKPNHIECAFPSFTNLTQSEIDIAWYKYPESENYIINILNDDNTMIFMDVVSDTIYRLDAGKLKLKKQKMYRWFIADAKKSFIVSDTNSVVLLSDENKTQISDTLMLLKDELGGIETPFGLLSISNFYIHNDLNYDALAYFRKAMLMVRNSEEVKKLFAKFLLKQKLYVEASELLEDKMED